MEALTITTLNVLPALTYLPDGNMLILFVNGTALFSIGPNPAFTLVSKNLVWISTIYSLPPGATTIVTYTTGANMPLPTFDVN